MRGCYLVVEARFWMNLQAAYDLSAARAGADFKRINPRRAA
jgi:plasmid maintenance system antidote protein VapI